MAEMIGKYSVFVVLSLFFVAFENYIQGDFIDDFIKGSLLECVWTFVAIHTAGGAVMAGHLKMLEGEISGDFTDTFVAMRNSFYEVFFLFLMTMFLAVLYRGKVNVFEWHHYCDAIKIMLLVAVFAIFYAIFDLTRATYSMYMHKD
ncbi:hypothetical protein RVX_R24060 [Nitratidesulfovibrio sp. HK-II]|uniref:hypothetical protein n=1 Tax=Nitratidesulfovibrio sp. HK-II TaxID=2009266 RepID=UPI0011C02BE8|nr:hypothetical protein [Nitratidesulfovibrio sp. HK-II]